MICRHVCGDNYLYACQEMDRLAEKQSRIVQDKDFDPHFVIFSQIDLQIKEANDRTPFPGCISCYRPENGSRHNIAGDWIISNNSLLCPALQ